MIYAVTHRGEVAALTVHEYCALPAHVLAHTRVFFSVASAFAHAAKIKNLTPNKN